MGFSVSLLFQTSKLLCQRVTLQNLNKFPATQLCLHLKINKLNFFYAKAREIINERPGMATRLLYQLFISLGKKTKMNLTGFAMETMRPQGPARLGVIETELYKEVCSLYFR